MGKIFLRVVMFVLVFAVAIGGLNVFAEYGEQFSDVPAEAWFSQYVNVSAEAGVLRGVSETEFAPHATMSRAMLVTVLHRLAGEPAAAAAPFADITPGAWYAGAVAWAAASGIVDGVGGNLFAPGAEVTREQTATILFRYALHNNRVSGALAAIRLDFADVAEISEWATDGLMYAVRNELLRGRPDGTLDPQGHATRAEMAAIFYRFISLDNRCALYEADVDAADDDAVDVDEAGDDYVILTILHINDTHGRTGAEAYIAALAQSLAGNVLILDGGDRMHGQTPANLSRGESMAGIMNAVGYSAMVAGNHDFNFGIERMLELAEMLEFPMLSANVFCEAGENLHEAYVIFEMDGITVGVFGLTTPESATSVDPRIVGDLTFAEPVEIAEAKTEFLQERGADLVIALAHLGDDESTIPQWRSDALAAVYGLDIVVDGHSHSLHESGRLVNSTLIAQTGEHGQNVGVIEVTRGGEISARTIPVDEDFPVAADPAVLQRIAEEEARVEPVIAEVVGYTAYALDGERENVRAGETNLSNLLTDSMRWASGADVAFKGGGGIRTSIEAGDITKGDVLSVLPFSNLIVTLDMTGAELFAALEHGVELYPEPSGRFIHLSGIWLVFDPDAEPGSRVVSATLADGTALDLEATYTVAMPDFNAAGGDGYNFENATNRMYFGDDAEALANFLRTSPAISAEAEGRVAAN